MPIVKVPVLTPRLSSYWLALVTDVDVTTGRNLIDSMGTEVLVTDHSIRDLVPGEPAALRRGRTPRPRGDALESPTLGLRPERGSTGSTKQHREPTRHVGDDRGQDAAGGASLEADEGAEEQRGEGEHHVAGGQGGGAVGQRW